MAGKVDYLTGKLAFIIERKTGNSREKAAAAEPSVLPSYNPSGSRIA